MRDRLAYSIEEATEAANTGKTALYEALGSGELPAHKRGRRTLILAADLRAWLEKLPPLELKRTPNLSGDLGQGCAEKAQPNDKRPVEGAISAERERRDPEATRLRAKHQSETQGAEQETEQRPPETYARRVMSASRTSPRLSTAKEIALAFGGSGVASASAWPRSEKNPTEEPPCAAPVPEPSLLCLADRGLDLAAFSCLPCAIRATPSYSHAASKAEGLVR